LRSHRALRDIALVALTRALVSASCLWSGFRAVSDDDYSRVVIAARFAAAPSLDPSGTSWLPVPFWLYGVPMALFGDSLTVARAVAFVLGVASAILVWGAALLLGLTPLTALLGALGAALLPYGAWLSVATVPEAPCAALILFGVVSLARSEGKVRIAGSLALGAACFCRYDAWAPAAVFAAISAVQALRAKRRDLGLAALLAAGPIALWLLHGVVRHGDALFFVARVNQYQAALGRAPLGVLRASLDTLGSIVRFEPELAAVTGVALVFSVGKKRWPFSRAALGPVVALAALVVFLIAAAARGSSATHHPERSLLPVYWFLALLAAGLLAKLADAGRGGWQVPALAVPLAFAGNLSLRPAVRDGFAQRSEEEQVGNLLRSIGASQVALDTDDYGYFAVQAALGHGKSFPLYDLDPRSERAPRATTTPALGMRLRESKATWLVTPHTRAALAEPFGRPLAATERLSVIELDPRVLSAAR
jgi:hypothetical protein